MVHFPSGQTPALFRFCSRAPVIVVLIVEDLNIRAEDFSLEELYGVMLYI